MGKEILVLSMETRQQQCVIDASAGCSHVVHLGFGGLFRIFNLLQIFPRVLRDSFYDLFANYRYRLFGKYDKCDVPSKEIVDRFIYD